MPICIMYIVKPDRLHSSSDCQVVLIMRSTTLLVNLSVSLCISSSSHCGYIEPINDL